MQDQLDFRGQVASSALPSQSAVWMPYDGVPLLVDSVRCLHPVCRMSTFPGSPVCCRAPCGQQVISRVGIHVLVRVLFIHCLG